MGESHRIVALGAVVAFAAIACGPPPPPPPPAEVEVGTGATDYAPLEGDQPLVPGSQGGFHVWVKLRVSNCPEGKINLKRTARRVSDGKLVLTASTVIVVGEAGAGGYWETPDPIPAFMCPSPIGIRVMDEPIVFNAALFDEAGNRVAEGNATATPRCPTGDLAKFCEQICSG